jgi:4-hydroxy 2-oxovalerate aldolase
MAQHDLKLLDCTLRDGGYVNDWKWGYKKARNIIKALVKANIDFVEVGFLRNVEGYNPDITVCNHIEDLNNLLPEKTCNTVFSGMAMRSNYDIKKLSPYSGKGIEMIRITAHDYDIEDGMDFAKEVKDRGYKLSINPINIMGYSDEKILWILEQVNKILPYQFSIVDTFGSMKHKDLDRIVSLVDNNLDRNIRVGLHLHENMAISCLLAQSFIDKHLQRSITVDGSLQGMGRIPGNLPIELIADYANEYADSNYDIDYLMDAIQDYIDPIKGHSEWGYTPAYFLSARFNLHRNYAEHYLKKGDLTHRDINHILARFDSSKKTAFDAKYADCLYEEYKNNTIDDSSDFNQLKGKLKDRDILVIAPGSSLIEYKEKIDAYISSKKPFVISINFIPDNNWADMVFFSNAKRYEQFSIQTIPTIITSNIKDGDATYRINYNTLSTAVKLGTNSFVMLLKLLKSLEVASVSVVGADGFKDDKMPYYNNVMSQNTSNGNQYNLAVREAISTIGLNINFITPSAYVEE